jgi:translation elongation factor EF-4
MDIERERGSRSEPGRYIPYAAKDGKRYTLNFVDTPGMSTLL